MIIFIKELKKILLYKTYLSFGEWAGSSDGSFKSFSS